jgi:NitT/TauT family transport system substrate-binding protein
MKKSTIVLSIVLIVIIFSAIGIYISQISTPKVKVRIGYLTGDLHHLALFVAIANNYFANYGIEYEVYEYINGPTLMQHFLAGELDFGYVGTPPALIARSQSIGSPNAPIAIASANLEGSALVVNPNIIKSISDLNGKKIGTPGTGTIQDVMLSIFIKNNNLNITKYPMTVRDLPLAFARGEIDGFIAWEPYPSIAIYQYNASILLTSKDLMPDHQCCLLVVSEKFLNSRPDIVEKMVKIHITAINFINSNPLKAKEIAINKTGLPEKVIESALSRIKYTATINTESIKTFLNESISLGIIKNVDPEKIDEFLKGFISTKFIGG